MKRILIIGTGSIGERHLRCFQQTGQATVAACEPNEELGRAVAERNNCPWYPSLSAALEADTFDAAVICTPAHTHIPIARNCVVKGLHVLIEKPLAVSTEGIEELAAEAAAADRTIRVAYVHRAMQSNQRLKELLASGIIGAPRQIVVTSGQNFPFFRPAYRNIYYARHESGGGAIQDALTHTLHSVEWITGSPIRAVSVQAEHLVLDGVEVEDTVSLAARLESGALANFSLNQFQLPNEHTISIHGEKGSLRAEMHNRRIGTYQAEATDWTWEELPTFDRDTFFIRQAEYFLAAMKGDRVNDILSTLAEGYQTLRVNLAALESAREHREVCIPA